MKVLICIGSACHVNGSYRVRERFAELVRQNHLEDRVQLGSSICLGHCDQGVSIQLDGRLITGVTPENAESVFENHILKEAG